MLSVIMGLLSGNCQVLVKVENSEEEYLNGNNNLQ